MGYIFCYNTTSSLLYLRFLRKLAKKIAIYTFFSIIAIIDKVFNSIYYLKIIYNRKNRNFFCKKFIKISLF